MSSRLVADKRRWIATTGKERQKFRDKGIFTVTQLSYTFRPHRRPKRFRDKQEKYHYSLKALAIREKKIHIVGSPELRIEGTPVYLDVEGLPDRDFYYLIGVRIGNEKFAIQHSLWADTIEDERAVWQEFLTILETIDKPVIIHYGSYETEFLKKMNKRYGIPTRITRNPENQIAINLLLILHGQVYFPTYSNGLKDIGGWLGDIVRGSFTEASVRGYLVLLSICQICKCNGLDFFDFLRSGEQDIYAFAKSRRGRRPTIEPKVLPANESAHN